MAYAFSPAEQFQAPVRQRVGQTLLLQRVVEVFILIQFLWGALLFIPGAQEFRMYIRALPYVSSVVLFAVFYGPRYSFRLPAAGKLVVLALILLLLNLAHQQTQFMAGLAQIAFQFSIAAPVFWGAKAVRGPAQLNRLIWLIFVAVSVNSLVGLLQIYFPEYVMPPEFSSLAQRLNPDFLEPLTYEGSGGQNIIRPPGLTDMPGGAAAAGMMTGIMGIAFALRRDQKSWVRIVSLAMACIGMVTLYLTQVRALFIMMVVALVALCVIAIRRGRRRQAIHVAFLSLCLVGGSFLWARTIGGEWLEDRFLGIAESGVLESFQESRGLFLEYTLKDLLFEYPMGAGLGRWGMMNVYFADDNSSSPPIWVEIQLTGWLLDGGVFMWIFYGGALLLSLMFAYRQAVTTQNNQIVHVATLVFCLGLIIVGTSIAGPTFNTQMGTQFWFLISALYGATAHFKFRHGSANL